MDDDVGFDDNDFDEDDQASEIIEGGDIDADAEGDEEQADDFDMDAKVGHLSRAEIQHLSPEEQLKKWHEMLLPTEVDLISELDATNIFFINAESVIGDLVISSGEGSFDEEGQFLRMTFLVEQLLASMQSCGGVFRLIFFDAFKSVFEAAFDNSLWAFREAFLNHCRANRIDHAVFPHWYSQEWKDHITTWRPSFFLLADDSLASLGEKDDDDDEEDDEDDVKKKGSFQAMMLRCLSFRVHVALLRGLQRRGNRVMAFTVEPDNHDSFIDFNVQGALQPLLEEEEEEEEQEADVVAALQGFQKRAADQVQPDALLRSLLLCQFAKNTLAAAEKEKGAMSDVLRLTVRVMMVQEMLLRYLTLDKRAFSTVSFNDWGLWSDCIEPVLQNAFYPHLAKELGRWNKLPQQETLGESCDLFDGRLFGHLFKFVVEESEKDKKNEVKAEAFGFSKYVMAELEFLWSEASSKEKFFPFKVSGLKELNGLKPPALEPAPAARNMPALHEISSDLKTYLWKDTEFAITEKDEDTEGDARLLWDRYSWREGVRINAVAEAQAMEKNEGQKKMEEKMRAKGKITDKDREFERKFHLKMRQLGLKKLDFFAKSLAGADKLHNPIINVRSEQKTQEEVKPAKISAKQQELIDKNEEKRKKEIQEQDEKQLAEWEKKVEALAQVGNPSELEKELLDLLIGYNRIMDSFVGFPALQGPFKTQEAQVKVIVKVVKNLQKVLKKLQLDKIPPENQVKVRSLVVYIYCLVQEAWNSYGRKGLLDGRSIKLFQELLIALGFPLNAKGMFQEWKKAQISKGEDKDDADAKDKKKGKDDKKDDKKDKKKEKEKDKKDDKKDKKDKDAKGSKDAKDDDPDDFEVTKKVEPFWSGVGADEYAFQLLYMGPQMTRLVGTSPDSRVGFKPDKWQRDLLDVVDNHESALVIAPTASGKTFIGYYAMDQVLRDDHEGIAVYIAPSKALVNQVSAEIYARFGSKVYPAHSTKELFGVFLKEYNSAGGVFEAGKWRKCQVLVTVPHIFEMLLLSAEYQDWVAQLRYVVFDEVHCIGGQEDGVQWEHCMQLIPCPFIALSATVADPTFFHSWLSHISKQKDLKKVSIVEHKERWNDLYKYVWHKGEIRPLHPFCCLVESSVRRNGMSADLSLVPREMVQLHHEVGKIIGANAKWDKLSPGKYFAGMAFATKIDSRKYEKDLKETFMELLQENTLKSEGFAQLTLALQQNPEETVGGTFNPPPRTEEETDLRTLEKSTSYLQAATLFKLCKDLHNRDILPAIFFNFSRKEIERMLKKLIDELEKRQYDKYFGDEDAKYRTKKINERRKAEYDKKKDEYDKAQKMLASSKQEATAARKNNENEGRAGRNTEAVDTTAELMMVEPQEPTDIADEIDPEFSFHSAKALGVWQEDIDELINKSTKEPWMKEGLRRGIGMHHEGLKRPYKEAVEILFRRGYLRVVFATGTLALGINMPCRSTIFCGDSLELTGLMYRQMSGRAGRRGFDLLGQVIFLDKAFSKIQRLVTSDLSTLAGEFTLSPTILLRALHEWETVGELEEEKTLGRPKEAIAKSLAPVFTTPFFESKTADLVTQVAYHSRFSLELLYQEGLIERDGSTRNLANFCAFLFEEEPANLIFGRLLSSGLLHEYLEQEAKKKEVKADRTTHLTVKLAVVLGWIFFRQRLPPSVPSGRPPRKKFLPSEGCPKLPALPPRIRKEVQHYNAQLFELFQQFAYATVSGAQIEEKDVTLPTSHRTFRHCVDQRGELFDAKSALAPQMGANLVKYQARSPFSALGGVGDQFRSPADLCKNCRNVLHLDLKAIPTVACPANAPRGAEADLEETNSWLLDYLIHGQRRYLWEDNGLNATKAYKLIDDFIQMLKKAERALQAFAPKEDLVLNTMSKLALELADRQKRVQKQ